MRAVILTAVWLSLFRCSLSTKNSDIETVVVTNDAVTSIVSELNETYTEIQNETTPFTTQQRLSNLEQKMDSLIDKVDELIRLAKQGKISASKPYIGQGTRPVSSFNERGTVEESATFIGGYLDTLSVENYDNSICNALWIETTAITLENHIIEALGFLRSSEETEEEDDESDFTTVILIGCKNGTLQVWDEMQYRMDNRNLKWLTPELSSKLSDNVMAYSTSLIYLKGYKSSIAVGMRDFDRNGECSTVLLTIDSNLEVSINVMDYSQGRFDLNVKECVINENKKNKNNNNTALKSRLFQVSRNMYIAQWLSGNRVVIARTTSGRVSSEYKPRKGKNRDPTRDKRCIYNQFFIQMNPIKKSGFSLIRRSKKRSWALVLAMHQNLTRILPDVDQNADQPSTDIPLTNDDLFVDLSMVSMPSFIIRYRSPPIPLSSLLDNYDISDPSLSDVRIVAFVNDRRLKTVGFAVTVALFKSDQTNEYQSSDAYLSAIEIDRGDGFGTMVDSFMIPEFGLEDLCMNVKSQSHNIDDSSPIDLSVVSGYLLITSKCSFNIWWFNSTSIMKGISSLSSYNDGYVRPAFLAIEKLSSVTNGISPLVKIIETYDEIPRATFLAVALQLNDKDDTKKSKLTVTVSESRATPVKNVQKKKGFIQSLVGSPIFIVVIVFLLGSRGIAGKRGGSSAMSSLPIFNVVARIFGGRKRGIGRRRHVPFFDEDGRRLTKKERWQMKHPNHSSDGNSSSRSTSGRGSSKRSVTGTGTIRHTSRNVYASDSD